MSAMMTQSLSSGEFCKPRYDTMPVKIASANIPFYTDNSKMPNLELRHACRKRAKYIDNFLRFFSTIIRIQHREIVAHDMLCTNGT